MFYGPECHLSWWMYHVYTSSKSSEFEKNVYLGTGLSSWNVSVLSKLIMNSVFDCWICPFMWGTLKSPSLIMDSSNTPYVSQVLFTHIFWHSAVRYIHVMVYYVFVDNWPLYCLWNAPLFILDNFPYSEFYSEINLANLLFWLVIA